MDNFDIEKLKSIISELEDKTTPLTKSKNKNGESKEANKEPNIEVSQPKEKDKKRWSEKKAEQFKLMQEKRKAQVDNIKKVKKLESAKILLSEALKSGATNKKQYLPKNDKDIKEDSEQEEEIIYIKKDKPKKKVKKIIIHQSSSESDSSSEEDTRKAYALALASGTAYHDDQIKLKTNREFKSARNKKSIVKVHDNNDNNKQPVNHTFNPNNFFV